MTYTVSDRRTHATRGEGLTAAEVVQRFVAEGSRSGSLALLQDMRDGQTLTLGDTIEVTAHGS